MIAKLQRLLSLAALLAGAGWCAWWWPSPHAAWALIALAPHAPVLAAECLWMGWVNRPRPAAVLRAWAGEVVQGWRVFGWRQPWRADAVPDAVPPRDEAWAPPLRGEAPQEPLRGEAPQPPLRGVVFVHGYVCNRGFWTPWFAPLQAEGRAFVAVTLEPIGADVERHAGAIQAAVDRVAAATGGLAPVLVCHSLGGLVVRAWLRGGGRAHRVVTLGTPHAGTLLARFGTTACTRQMRRGNAWLAALAADEAPGGYAGFTCWWSDCDNVVFPAATATLPSADNRLLPGQAHVSLAFHPRVLAETLEMLRKT